LSPLISGATEKVEILL